MKNANKPPPPEDPLRPHSYDGIQEYDKRLPNWWLFTLYASIAFSLFYWFYYHLSGVGGDDHRRLADELSHIEAVRAASRMGSMSDAELAALSRNPVFVSAGKDLYGMYCVACHLPSLRGQVENPLAVGPSLVDPDWIHGGTPLAIKNSIANGIIEKGMQAWGPILGDQKVVELVAYVLSRQEGPVD